MPSGMPVTREVYDLPVGNGPAAGIAAALQRCDDWCFIAAADMPFLDANLIRLFEQEVETLPKDVKCALPIWKKGKEPLHAFYRKDALDTIIDFLAGGQRSLNMLADLLDARLLDAERAATKCGSDLDLSFFNVNTIEDLEHAREIFYRLGIQNGPS